VLVSLKAGELGPKDTQGMTIFFTSDAHFGDGRVLLIDHSRPSATSRPRWRSRRRRVVSAVASASSTLLAAR
jgi:hypothetical protein